MYQQVSNFPTYKVRKFDYWLRSHTKSRNSPIHTPTEWQGDEEFQKKQIKYKEKRCLKAHYGFH